MRSSRWPERHVLPAVARTLVGTIAIAVAILVGAACSGADSDNAESSGSAASTADASTADASDGAVRDFVDQTRDDLVPESVEPEIDLPAFRPAVLPDGFEIIRVSAASPAFMSIAIESVDPDNAATASLIWGEELSAFEVLADRDPGGAEVDLGDSVGTLFTFDSDDGSAGPALIWREPPDLPVLVVGSPELSTEQVMAIARGVERTSQQDFLDLAIKLAEQQLLGS